MNRPTLTDLLANASQAVQRLNPTLFNSAPLPGLSLSVQADDTPPAPKLERRSRARSLAKGKVEEGDSRRFFVRVTSFRRRLLDEDNLCEKYVVDLCRYAGILPEDSASKARIVTTQEKVGCKEDERTEVEISLIP